MVELLLPQFLQARLLFHDLVFPDRSEERVQVGVEVLREDSQIPIEKEQELFLHEVDFGD